MLRITCPVCAARYHLEPTSIGPDGRHVRCAACATVWLAHPEPVVPEPPDEIVAVPVGFEPAQVAAIEGEMRPKPPEAGPPPAPVETIETAARRGLRAGKGAAKGAKKSADTGGRRKRAGAGPAVAVSPGAWVMLGLAALLAGAVMLRNDVVRAAPALATLYEHAGLPVNVRGIVFENITTTHETEGGQTVLIIEGRMRNLTGDIQPTARLRLALLSPTGNEMRSWAIAPPRPVLGPREVLGFRNRVLNPPREAETVAVRFITVRDTRLTETGR